MKTGAVRAVFVLALATGLLSGFQRPSDASRALDVRYHTQRGNNWCWAATAQMMIRFIDPARDTLEFSQCRQASRQHRSQADCCHNPMAPTCDFAAWPQFDSLGYSVDSLVGKALTWDQLVAEIDHGRPVAFSWYWKRGTGHMMVAYGYQVVSGKRFVLVHDPNASTRDKRRRMSYSEYVSSSRHEHWNDYYLLRKRAVPGVAE